MVLGSRPPHPLPTPLEFYTPLPFRVSKVIGWLYFKVSVWLASVNKVLVFADPIPLRAAQEGHKLVATQIPEPALLFADYQV